MGGERKGSRGARGNESFPPATGFSPFFPTVGIELPSNNGGGQLVFSPYHNAAALAIPSTSRELVSVGGCQKREVGSQSM